MTNSYPKLEVIFSFQSPMDRHCAEHQAAKAHLLKTSLLHDLGQLFSLQEILRRLRQVGIGLCLASDDATQVRNDEMQMKIYQRSQQIPWRLGGIQGNCKSTTFENPVLLLKASLDVDHIAQQKARDNRIESVIREGHA